MKYQWIFLFFLLFVCVALAQSAEEMKLTKLSDCDRTEELMGTLDVNIVDLENDIGQVHALVYFSESQKDFPNHPKKADLCKVTNIENGTCKVTFKIPYGKTIAVSILHDKDKNDKMNKFIWPRFPLEGFGTSRVNKLQMPKYPNSEFQFNQDMEITVKALYLKHLFPWLSPKNKEK